jgi:hypothetical protein
MEYFAEQVIVALTLGTGAGIQGDESDSLIRFKRGWANGQRTTYVAANERATTLALS